jgi:superoxide reductase
MTKRFEIYKCNVCGNIIEVMIAGGGRLVCCGQSMEQLKEKTEDTGKEKHVPVVEGTDKGVKVKVGSVPHPMEEKHHIQFVEVLTEDGVMRKFLKPGAAPEAEFEMPGADPGTVKAREFCNIHGLWKN